MIGTLNKRTLVNLAMRAVELVSHPTSLVIKAKGGIADLYLRLNKPWFYDFQIDTVLDIGGNIGLFSSTIRQMLPKVNIYAFEPLPDCYEQMVTRMGNDPLFKGFNIGLGTEKAQLTIERSSHAPSSSFLKMTNVHKSAFPFTAETSHMNVQVERLDDVALSLDLGKRLMIKVDVQGFEDKVLEGGIETFKKADFLLMELSYKELYEGQPLFADIFRKLSDLGFEFRGTLEQLPDPKSLEFLDADCIFVNKRKRQTP